MYQPNDQIPQKGFAGLKAHFKDDLIAGFSVSLIALPLCLSIAIASGMPPLAGIITAIVGGMFASRLAGTYITISGPAAGLIVINLTAMENLGGAGAETGYAGYPFALATILIGGLIMVVLGFLKVGKLGDVFPPAVVHGMLAAIGFIIIIKQIYPALGVTSPKGEVLEVAAHIPFALKQVNLYAMGIALVSILILVIHPYIKSRIIKLIPAPMWVLLVSIPLASIIGGEHLELVNMPESIFGADGIQFPSFAKIGESAFWVAVVSIALVSGIETLLSAKAVDSLDPYHRKSNLNKDLISMGAGSSLASLIGGLPMISEIVRSSANVNNGAKTQWANFFHGAFLLLFLLAGSKVISMIPTSALAGMLIFTGFRLASPKEFRQMYRVGLMELEIFIVTIIAVLATDLLIGIAIGIVFKYILLLLRGVSIKDLFRSEIEVEEKGNHTIFKLKGVQIFSNYLSLRKKLDTATLTAQQIDLDFTDVTFIDHTVMGHLTRYGSYLARQNKQLNIIHIDNLNPLSAHPLAGRDKFAKKLENNPNFTNQRKIALFHFANENGFSFQNKADSFQEWSFYSLTTRKRLKAIENILTIKTDDRSFLVADVIAEEGAGITTQQQATTILKIKGMTQLPRFFMQQELLVDKMAKIVKGEDINFDSHPVFSEAYILRSDDNETDVRHFFNENLLSYLEKDKNCFLISNGTDLLIHKGEKLLNPKEIEALIADARSISSFIAPIYHEA